MELSEAQAVVASGGMQLGGSLIAGILSYYATQDANRKNYSMELLSRGDTLAQNREQNKLAKAQFALAGRQQNFVEQESRLNRAETAEERGYGRAMSNYQRGADLLTQQMNMNATRAAPLIRNK